ncbi:MAG: crotonase/enoyl-CoA hydratase family protein [Acidimicrobiales bacterium]|nr:crotonase/enoyl-CoA hydratase family protein [Acidimicrobiales bacterium]
MSDFETDGDTGGPETVGAPVLYEERDDLAIITLNRPDKKNALTDAVIQGIADGIDAATKSPDVAAVVLRGSDGTLTAGYDLTAGTGVGTSSGDEEGWSTPYGAKGPEPREGAWDPVRDYQFMSNNVRRFMKVWECPKPVIGEIRGWAIGGATDLILCADLLYMASDAHIGYAPSRIFGTPTTMLWVYRLGLEHAKQFLLTGRAIDAETAHRIGLVSQVCEPDELSAEAEAEARRFRHIPANQLALNKLLINQAYENMGLRTSQMLGTFFDGVTRHTEEAYRWAESFDDKGFREVIRERDAPWKDYGERPQ